MKEREDIIKYFKDKGYEAFARDWALGKSVGIPWGKSNVESNGVVITIWKEIIYIFFRDGQWFVYSPFLGKQIMLTNVEEAIAEAEKFLALVKTQYMDEIHNVEK